MLVDTLLPISKLILLIIAVFILTFSTVYFPQYEENTQAVEIINNELARQKEALLNQEGTLSMNWLRTLNPLVKEVQGSVVWNSSMQSGVMIFKNLPKLDKKQSYKLWIYDLENSVKFPVSAGVFKPVTLRENPFYVEIRPERLVKNPFKFELVLVEKNKNIVQQLLLAQP